MEQPRRLTKNLRKWLDRPPPEIVEKCPCDAKPQTETVWYAGMELQWNQQVFGDDQLDELQALLDREKKFGRKACVVHEGCCHYLYLEPFLEAFRVNE